MKKLKALIDNEMISAVGTDAHNLTSRSPKFAEAEKVLRRKCGNSAFEEICESSMHILSSHK